MDEARIEETDRGKLPRGDGWYVLNAREAQWRHVEGRSAVCDFEGDVEFPQLGVNVSVLQPGEPMAMVHWEADQENFLVVAGDAVLLVEGEERPLRAWDFVHCPPGTTHAIVGAGDGPCVVVSVGARIDSTGSDWGGYTVEGRAARYGATVAADTTDPAEAYAHLPRRRPTRYRDGWLPDLG